MFNFGKKKGANMGITPKPGAVYATQTGGVLPIENMPDEIFANKILGDGVCLIPESSEVYSPVTGRVDTVADTAHAFGITADDGAEILIHIGVDTVGLGLSAFKPHVKAGARIGMGDAICTADLAAIKAAGLPTHTAVVLTNTTAFTLEKPTSSPAIAGKTVLFCYKKK